MKKILSLKTLNAMLFLLAVVIGGYIISKRDSESLNGLVERLKAAGMDLNGCDIKRIDTKQFMGADDAKHIKEVVSIQGPECDMKIGRYDDPDCFRRTRIHIEQLMEQLNQRQEVRPIRNANVKIPVCFFAYPYAMIIDRDTAVADHIRTMQSVLPEGKVCAFNGPAGDVTGGK